MINELIKKLRKAADVLDDLMDSIPSNNHKAVESILNSKSNKPKQKRVYTKPHWTQLPKNKEKVKLLGIKAAKTRKTKYEKT